MADSVRRFVGPVPDYFFNLGSPHISRWQLALLRGKIGEISAILENIPVNLPSAKKNRMTYWSRSGSRPKNVVSPMPEPELLREFRTPSEPALSV
jgi:hypothetical protein